MTFGMALVLTLPVLSLILLSNVKSEDNNRVCMQCVMHFWYCLTCWCRFSVQNLIRICFIMWFYLCLFSKFNYIVVYYWHFRTHVSVGSTCCLETLVTNYQLMLHNNPKEQTPQLHCGRNLKPSYSEQDYFFLKFNFLCKQQWSELQECMEFYDYMFCKIAVVNPLLNVIELL